jgi:4'-phosphopantetheinyl transferase
LTRYFLRRAGRDGNREISRGAHGKPYLAGDDGLYFNVSHSGDYVVAAFADREVGIDIERRGRARMEVADRFFHAGEIAALWSAGEETRRRLFTDYWAIKESFLKYLGTGLSRPLSTFRVEIGEAGIFLREGDTRLPVHVYPCEIDAAYSCFTCGEAGDPPLVEEVRWRDLVEG